MRIGPGLGQGQGLDLRPVTPGDLLAAARCLMTGPDRDWPRMAARLLARAACAERFRQRTGRPHPRHGNGTLMAVAGTDAPPAKTGDMRHLAALCAVIAAILARSERLERHRRQGAADTGDVEQRL